MRPRVPPGYDDLMVQAFVPRTSAPTLAQFGAAALYPINSWSFANNGTERGLDAMTQIPHATMQGSAIYLHLHCSTTGAVVAGVDVGFFVSMRIQPIGLATYFEGVYWCKRTVPVGGYGAKTHISTEEVPIDLTNIGQSAMLWMYVFRIKGTAVATLNAGNVTENVNDVLWLHQLDLHVRRAGFGTPTTATTW